MSEPENKHLWDQYAEKRKQDPDDATAFYIANRADMDKGAAVLWEERKRPYDVSEPENIMKYRADWGEASYQTELQSSPPQPDEIQDEHLSTRDITKKVIDIPRGIVPNDTKRLTVGVDVGKHLLHYSVMAFDRMNSGHVVDYGTVDVPAFPDTAYSIKKALTVFRDEILRIGWKTEAGDTRLMDVCLCDSGYMPEVVAAWAKEVTRANIRHVVGASA